MDLTYEDYDILHAALLEVNLTREDKEPIKELKKNLRQAFKKAYPKGFDAKAWKAHKEGQKIIQISYKPTEKEEALLNDAKPFGESLKAKAQEAEDALEASQV